MYVRVAGRRKKQETRPSGRSDRSEEEVIDSKKDPGNRSKEVEMDRGRKRVAETSSTMVHCGSMWDLYQKEAGSSNGNRQIVRSI